MTLPDEDLAAAMAESAYKRDMDVRYREAFDADLEFMMTPQVDLTKERGMQDIITRSQPAREVRRQEGATKLPGPLACVIAFLIALLVAVFAAPVLGKGIASLAHFNANHISRGAW